MYGLIPRPPKTRLEILKGLAPGRQRVMRSFGGGLTRERDIKVVVNLDLPIVPTPGEDARRRVRHGYFDVLHWLGEKVGPYPGEVIHAVLYTPDHGPIYSTLYVSPQAYDSMSRCVEITDGWTCYDRQCLVHARHGDRAHP